MSNNSSNSGCNIFIILTIIVSVIAYLVIDIKDNSDRYAEAGSNLITIISIIISGGILYLIYRFISSPKDNNTKKNDSKEDNGGCLKPALWTIGGIILFVAISTLIGNNYELNKGIGITYVVLILSIIIGFIIYYICKDN